MRATTSWGGAIGCAGIEVLDDRRGQHDMFGRELKVTMINRADSIAAMATLIMGESIERTPVAVVQGFAVDTQHGRAADIIRPAADDHTAAIPSGPIKAARTTEPGQGRM